MTLQVVPVSGLRSLISSKRALCSTLSMGRGKVGFLRESPIAPLCLRMPEDSQRLQHLLDVYSLQHRWIWLPSTVPGQKKQVFTIKDLYGIFQWVQHMDSDRLDFIFLSRPHDVKMKELRVTPLPPQVERWGMEGGRRVEGNDGGGPPGPGFSRESASSPSRHLFLPPQIFLGPEGLPCVFPLRSSPFLQRGNF